PARRLPVPVDRGDHPEFDPVRPHPGAGDDDLRAVPVAWTVAAQSAVLTAQPKEETMTRLTKRSFLGLALASGTLAINGMPLRIRTAHAAQTVTGVTYLTPTYQALMWGINGFVERLKEAGGDAITVEFYDSGSLLKADAQTSALRSGTIDFMVHTTSYISRSFKILGVTGLPSLVEELYRHGDRMAMGSPLFELINEQLAAENIYMLTGGGGIMEPEYIW